jgi:hypothetical protein
MQVYEFCGTTLSQFIDFSKKDRTVGVLRREFTTSRESLDLTRGAGEIRRSISKVKSSGGAGSLIRATRVVGSIRTSCIRFSWIETQKYCNGNRDIAIHDIPMGKKIVWGHSGVGEWTGGIIYQGFAARSLETLTIGFVISRSPKSRQR